MNEELLKQIGAKSLDDPTYGLQLRLGLQGMMGSGKTHAAMRFTEILPDDGLIIAASFDRGLISWQGNTRIKEVPFYRADYVNSLVRQDSLTYVDMIDGNSKPRPPNRKDAFTKWMYDFAVKIARPNILVVDNGTAIQAAYHVQYRTNPAISKKGEENKFLEWRWKIDFFTELMMCIKGLQCDVIWIMHESEDRNDKGDKNGQLRPLMSGQFVDEIGSHFTDWFRCITIAKPTNADESGRLKNKFMVDYPESKRDYELSRWITSTPNQVIYLWQTQPDGFAICKTSLIGCPKFVLADPAVFIQYKRKQSDDK